MYYIISMPEYRELVHRGIVSSRLAAYWQDVINNLPPLLKQEARSKSFKLVPHDVFSKTGARYAANLMFEVVDSSQELRRFLAKSDFVVICMLDEPDLLTEAEKKWVR